MENKQFNIRVYGLLINEKDQILISDESRGGVFFTKFPGGGLEWGEGIKDCLKREFMEELAIHIEVGNHFYTTDFFIASAFKSSDQLISIYYKVQYDHTNALRFEEYPTPFTVSQERFRWKAISNLTEADFTFPIDKLVAKKLREEFTR